MKLNKISELLNFKTSLKLIGCGALVFIADFLFYGENIGWTLGLFGFFLLVSAFIHNKAIAEHKLAKFFFFAALGLVFALLEKPTALAIWMYYISIILMVLLPKMLLVDDAREIAKIVIRYALTGWWRLQRDSVVIAYARKRWQKTHGKKRAIIRNWFVPVSLSVIFVMLFAQANPIITGWISNINLMYFADYFSLPRTFFWLFIACITWALIRPRLKYRKPIKQNCYAKTDEFTLLALLFNERSVLTSLILFNGLFLIQNVLDIAFLWSGAELPAGMTHAQYAHQGAYPLIATALLTAIFVLIAFKPKSAIENSPIIRALVYVWVGQNVFLVLSSITRLINYIGDYSLTYLRVTALVWMGLVALGLILIVARIYLQKSNKWLVNGNSFALYATLYLSCFINFGGIIADYNVKHSREAIGDKGVYLDVYYLQNEVGFEAIPALHWLEQNRPDGYNTQRAKEVRVFLQHEVDSSMSNWRKWTFRNYRLSQVANSNVEH